MEVLSECPICKNKEFILFLKCEDYTVSHETFQLVKCTSCGIVLTNPRPDSIDIQNYYQSDDYISHSNSTKGIFNLAYQQIRKIAIRGKVKLIATHRAPIKSILDYGSGTGEFLNAMKLAGWNCKGIEPSLQARELSIVNYSLNVNEPNSLSKFNDNEFGIITLWHVLEHVHQLNETVVHLNRVLVNGGYLLIAVPNREALDAENYKEYWAAYDVPRHLYHFSKDNITQLFSKVGLQLKEVRPMFYDPFYISLLSEKYKNGKPNYLSAIKTGIKTTLAGKKDIAKNSSLIYIFQKKRQ